MCYDHGAILRDGLVLDGIMKGEIFMTKATNTKREKEIRAAQLEELKKGRIA